MRRASSHLLLGGQQGDPADLAQIDADQVGRGAVDGHTLGRLVVVDLVGAVRAMLTVVGWLTTGGGHEDGLGARQLLGGRLELDEVGLGLAYVDDRDRRGVDG